MARNVSDKKKCATLINLAAEAAEKMQEAATTLKALRTAFSNQNVDPSGTPLEGNVQAVSNWIDNVDTVANAAIPNAMIAAKVPTHRNRALEV